MMPKSTLAFFLAVLVVLTHSQGVRAADDGAAITLRTPDHRPWATPLAGGAIKCDIWLSSKGLLDAQALSSAIDLNGTIHVYSTSRVDGTESVLKRLEKLDVLLCSEAAWTRATTVEKAAVFERVSQGMGLVFIGLEGSSQFTALSSAWMHEPVPASLDPDFSVPGTSSLMRESGEWETYTHGDSRIAYFVNRIPAFTQELIPLEVARGLAPKILYEYRQAALLRAIRWASRHESGAQIAAVTQARPNEPDVKEIPPQLPPEFTKYMLDSRMKTVSQSIAIRLDRPAPKDYSVAVRVRQPYHASAITYAPDEIIPRGAQEVVLHIPAGKGESWIDLWILNGADVVDWFSFSSVIDEWPTLTNFEVANPSVKSSDSLEVTFTVEKNGYKATEAYAFFELSDALGRVIREQRIVIDAEGGDVKALVNWSDALTTSLKLELYVVADAGLQLSEWSRKYSSYAYHMLNVENAPTLGLQWIADGSSADESWVVAANQELAGMGVNTLDVSSPEVEGPSGVEANLSVIAHPDILGRNVGDDHMASRLELASPAFRETLYERVEEWSAWARFRGARGMILSTAPALLEGFTNESDRVFLKAQLSSDYPNIDVLNENWGTHFREWDELIIPDTEARTLPMTVDLARNDTAKAINVLRNVNRQLADYPSITRLGVTDLEPGSQNHPIELSEWIPELSLIAIPPDALMMDKVRSYRSPGALSGIQLHSIDTADLPRLLWQSLFQGMNVVWTSGTNDDGTLSPELSSIETEMRAIRQGFDDLLSRANPIVPSVVIYENGATRYASTPTDLRARTRSQASAAELLRHLGIGYRFASYADLMKSGFEEFKMVMLPRVDALSLEEVALLSAYIKRGGVVIADGTPGALNEHGASSSQADLDLRPRTSVVFWDDEFPTIVEELAVAAEVPGFTLGNGEPYKRDDAFERYRFHYGKADIFGILNGPGGKNRTLRLAVPEGMYAYDALTGLELRTRRVRPSVNEAGASLVTLLPYRVSRILLDAPTIVQTGHRLQYAVEIKTFEALPGDHVVHVSLRDALGNTIYHYEHNLECSGGKGEHYIPLALNELKGRYSLHVRDVLTGTYTSVPIKIL